MAGMISTTGDRIILTNIREGAGFSIRTFKTTKDLLMAVVDQYFNEQMENSGGLLLCHLAVRGRIHARLDKIVKSYEDDAKEVCPISGAVNCHECSDRRVEECGGNWNG